MDGLTTLSIQPFSAYSNAASRTRIPHCLPSISARIYLDGCFLRYESFDFFNQSVDSARDTVNCATDVVRELGFERFAVGEGKGVYGLAQCWRSVSSGGCRECLEKAAGEVRRCVPSREGRGLNAGCYLRYSTVKFFNGGEKLQRSSGGSATGVIVTIVLAATAFFMLLFVASYACYMRFSRMKEERNNLGQVSASFNESSLNFKYEMLGKATDYFDLSRKIGQGGAGSVFKGTLPNGETVAAKRLFFNTRQWVDEFFNEVNLIKGTRHKNLVKLLGCSIEGLRASWFTSAAQTKALISSFSGKVQSLNWKQRLTIIVGTAEGLEYLHGGSETRIIHRDIKSSNVLLDENLAPKIADFGLARCFGADKTYLNTGIAGTF
ncbi:unnamed protein product [Camellia sinensis]